MGVPSWGGCAPERRVFSGCTEGIRRAPGKGGQKLRGCYVGSIRDSEGGHSETTSYPLCTELGSSLASPAPDAFPAHPPPAGPSSAALYHPTVRTITATFQPPSPSAHLGYWLSRPASQCLVHEGAPSVALAKMKKRCINQAGYPNVQGEEGEVPSMEHQPEDPSTAGKRCRRCTDTLQEL